jgi:hypothetical protein
VEIDRSAARIRWDVSGGITVVLPLSGDDPPVWKRFFNEQARGLSLKAFAVDTVPPWTVVLSLPAAVDEHGLRDGLDAVDKCMKSANLAGAKRPDPSMHEAWLAAWMNGLPPSSYPLT